MKEKAEKADEEKNKVCLPFIRANIQSSLQENQEKIMKIDKGYLNVIKVQKVYLETAFMSA